MSYACKYFAIEELTPPGHQNWNLLDENLLETLDEIHDLLEDHYSKECDRVIMRVNTWNKGGKFKLRGWRPRDCATGSQRSQHKEGRAADWDAYLVKNGKETRLDPDGVRELLIDWKLRKGLLKHLGGIETGVNWIHTDLRNYGQTLTQFKP